MLQVGITRQDNTEIRLGLTYERMTQRNIGAHQIQARIRCNLIVAAAARVQTRSRIADFSSERLFHRHMDILVVDIEREIT